MFEAHTSLEAYMTVLERLEDDVIVLHVTIHLPFVHCDCSFGRVLERAWSPLRFENV